MAAEPFNSKGGYSVGIPPIPVIDANGNISANHATFGGNVVINGNGIYTGNITADTFNGTFNGNISGNIVVPGQSTWVVFNEDGEAQTNQYFTFNSGTRVLTVDGQTITGSITMGVGNLEFSTSTVVFATSSSTSANQILHRTPANSISSIDYTIIATDTIGNNRQTTKLFAGILGDVVEYFEVGTIDVPAAGPGVGDFRVQFEAPGNVALTVTPVASTLVQYKIMVTSYKE